MCAISDSSLNACGGIIVPVAATKKLTKKTLAELGAELSVPIITASALRAMQHIENNHRHRKLVFIKRISTPRFS